MAVWRGVRLSAGFLRGDEKKPLDFRRKVVPCIEPWMLLISGPGVKTGIEDLAYMHARAAMFGAQMELKGVS